MTEAMWFVTLYRPSFNAVIYRKLSPGQLEQLPHQTPSRIVSLQEYLVEGERRVAEYHRNPQLSEENDRFLLQPFRLLIEAMRNGRAELVKVDGA